jgi:DNA repair protein RadC
MQQHYLEGLPVPRDDLPPSEYPVKRLMEKSADYLADSELLAVIIGTRLAPAAALETARAIIARAGSLQRAADMSVSELMQVPNVGKATACAIHSAFALAGRRLMPATEEKPTLESPAQVADYLRGTFIGLQQEVFHALLVNTKHRLLRDETVTVGLLDRSQVHAREVFRTAIRECCSRIIVAHNHPSGDPTPSAQDVACTKNLVAAGKIIGIELLDHVIIGRATAARPRDWLSLREEGLL